MGAAITLAIAVVAVGPASRAAPADKAFTVGNYPVDATAANAVAAKEQALADGQKHAFRSLLKRLVPVTSYKRIERLKTVRASDLIDGVSVRSERNSSTQYIANLDFAFQPQAVRDLLRREGIPFVDLPAPTVMVIPVYHAPPAAAGAAPAALSAAVSIPAPKVGPALPSEWKIVNSETTRPTPAAAFIFSKRWSQTWDWN